MGYVFGRGAMPCAPTDKKQALGLPQEPVFLFPLQEVKLHGILIDLNNLFKSCCAWIGELTSVFLRISSHQFKV